MNGDGTGFHTLAIPNGPVFVGCGVWSPDGKRIVAEGWNETDASQTGLYSLRSSDGGDARQITTSPFGHDIPFGFAPDGSSIAFTRDGQAGSAATLYLADPDGSHVRPWATSPSPAPIGLPMGDPSSSRARVDCSAWTWQPAGPRLMSSSATRPPSSGIPQWSPDGTRILFRMKVNNVFDFYTMRPDGTDVFQLTNEPEDDYFADWGA